MSQIPEQLWWTKEPNWTKIEKGLFEVTYGNLKGCVPYTFGVVVKVTNARYETYFHVGTGPIVVASGSTERIFDCVLGEGIHNILVITRTSEKNPDYPNQREWQMWTKEVTVEKRSSSMGIISNFFQTKAAGQYIPNTSSTGLDVAFSISVKENPKTLEWFFDEQGDPTDTKNHATHYWPNIPQYYSEDYSYKEKGVHTGYVKVIDNKGNEGKVKFSVVIGDNKKL